MVNGVAIWPILAGHRLIDDGEQRAAHGFRVIPQAALRKRNTQQREIFRTDEVHAYFGLFRRRAAEDFNRLRPAARGRRGVGGDARGHHLGHRRDSGANLLEVFGALLPGYMRVFVHGNGHGHGVVRVVAQIGVQQADEAFARGARCGEQQQGKRDLRSDQRAVSAFGKHASGDAAGAALHQPRNLRPRQLQGRQESKHNRGGERQRYAEQQHRHIHFYYGFRRERKLRKPRHDERESPPG